MYDPEELEEEQREREIRNRVRAAGFSGCRVSEKGGYLEVRLALTSIEEEEDKRNISSGCVVGW